MNWAETASAFTWDGSWRDLYVLGTAMDDWQVLVDCIRESGFQFQLFREEEEPLPKDVAVLLPVDENDIRPLLQVDLGGPVLNCHFFTEREIEFDLDPRQVPSEREAGAIFDFMRHIGLALGKPVRLTPENLEQVVLFEYHPKRDLLEKVTDWNDAW